MSSIDKDGNVISHLKPKPKKKSSRPRVIEKERDHIQPTVDEFYELFRLTHKCWRVRIPDIVYHAILTHPNLKKYQKAEIMSYLKSLPDNIFLKSTDDGYASALCLELKTIGNTLSQGQEKFAREVNTHIGYTFRESREMIEKWYQGQSDE